MAYLGLFSCRSRSNLQHILWMCIVTCLLALSIFPNIISALSAYKKFEYKYSFKPPYLAQKDGSVPFWEHSGNAIASEENLRVTPSLRSQKGQIWSKLQTTFDWWEVELVFRVSGRGRVGADGLGFWYRQERGQEGPVFGTSDQWNGLGIIFDSFDNDNKHNNPYIMAVVNDGTMLYDHQNDGSTQQLAGCLRDFRNKPFPVRAKIQYFKNVLVLLFNNGMSNNEEDYEMCMRVENVFLPARGFFGVSAATGGLADDHDVQKLMTWSLIPQEEGLSPPGPQTPSPDQQKFDQEFQNYQQQLDKKKEEYLKEHPDEKQKDEEDWFEEEQIRELRQIFQGQSEVKVLVQSLSRKLDEIVGRQETTISLVTSIQASGFAIGQQGGAGQPPVAAQPVAGGANIQRHEIDGILAASRELVQSTREIRNLLTTISSKQDQAAAKPASYGSGSVDYTNNFIELRDGINTVKRDLSTVSQRINSQPVAAGQFQPGSCPEVSCVSATLFIGLTIIQIAAFVGYSIYRSNKENQAKKFY